MPSFSRCATAATLCVLAIALPQPADARLGAFSVGLFTRREKAETVMHVKDPKAAIEKPPRVASKADDDAPVKYPLASPCAFGSGNVTRTVAQILLKQVAMDVYANRANETYSENMIERWVGVHDHICPPKVPRTSDCSSMVTWVYWSLFGNGQDFMNGEKWGAGYTGTLKVHGELVAMNPTSDADLQIGDLCFYYHPMHHTAIYVGDGKVVSHGMDPVGHYPWNYAPVDFCRRYI